MQTTSPKPIFTNVRVALTPGKGLQLAQASVIVADAMFITGIKVMQGTRDVFIGMPTRKHPITKEYTDVAFPTSKAVREELSAMVLAEYRSLIAYQEADQHLEAQYEERTELGD